MWTADHSGKYSLKGTYNALRRVRARGLLFLVWFANNIPKHSFIAWMAIRRALKTQNKFGEWGLKNTSLCVFCYTDPEDEDHLFFGCYFSRAIWYWILLFFEINHMAQSWDESVQRCAENFKGKNPIATTRKLAFNFRICIL